MDKSKASSVIPWGLLLTVLLLIVKVMWAPTLSWWFVFLPIWLPILFVVGLMVVLLVVAIIAVFLE